MSRTKNSKSGSAAKRGSEKPPKRKRAGAPAKRWPKQHVQGTIVEDPRSRVPIQNVPKFIGRQFVVNSGNHRKGLIRNWQGSEGTVLVVAFQHKQGDETAYEVLGSAVMVAPGVALTATHVIGNDDASIKATFPKMLVCGVLENQTLSVWHPTHMTMMRNNDTTLLSLAALTEFPRKRTAKLAVLTTRTPKVGESLYAVGFRAPDKWFSEAHFKLDLHYAKGVVMQVEPQGLGPSRPYPVAVFDADTLGGMSGGPIFDAWGHVIGTLPIGTDTKTDEVDPYSYIALLDHDFFARFPRSWPTELESTTLIDLAREGSAHIQRPEMMQCHYDDARNEFTPTRLIW